MAAGVDPDAVVPVDPRETQLLRRLRGATAVVADAIHAPMVLPSPRLVVFRLLSDESVEASKAYSSQVGTPA